MGVNSSNAWPLLVDADLLAILDSHPNGLLLLGTDGEPRYANRQYAQMWGLAPAHLTTLNAKALRDHITQQLDAPACVVDRFLVEVDASPQAFEQDFQTRDGRWLRRRVHDFIREGVKQGVICQWADVTAQHEASLKAQHEHDLLQELIENVPDQIYFKDLNSRFIRINPSLAKRYGLAHPDEAVGKSDADFYSVEHAAVTAQEEAQIIRSGTPVHNQLHLEKWRNGEESWNLSTKMPLRDPQGRIIGTFGISHDITAHKRHESVIWHQANYDGLTGLPNRRLLAERWEQLRLLAARTRSGLALMVLDLDHFKEVNDTLGHSTGDELIREVGRRLQSTLRASDTVARMGGDEFAVILNHFTQPLVAAEMAQKLISVLAEPFHVLGESFFISASIGVALYPSDGESLDTVLKHADQAMYQAKKLGRNRFSFYTDSLEQDARRRMRLANDMRSALLRHESLYLVYQPIVDMHTGRVIKAEVLVRWQHPTLGEVPAAEFVAVAESSGLIHELGQWVFETAVRQLVVWRETLLPELTLAINMSPMQVACTSSKALPLAERLAAASLPPDSITVEITEGVLLQPTDRVRQRLAGLRQAGIPLAIDDFGTGYSALTYLLQHDIQMIKIDREFVGGVVDNPKNQGICKAIMGMAHALDITVVAEGIETQEQHEFMRTAGCPLGQGYLYSAPLKAQDFESWVQRQR